ncbi:hypothetical protein BH09ACT12_BH09ACT12_24700 [soil metagenome]
MRAPLTAVAAAALMLAVLVSVAGAPASSSGVRDAAQGEVATPLVRHPRRAVPSGERLVWPERPSGPVAEPEPEPDPEPSAERDPLLWPYPSDSLWNTPRGDAASLIPAAIAAPTMKSLAAEEDLLFLTPDAPLQPVLATDAGWLPDRTRCGSRTGATLLPGLPIDADGFTTEGTYWGSRPNHSAAVVMPDYTLVDTQPLHVCTDGTVVSQYASPLWRGSSILTGGTADAVGAGSHGGSYLSAFGGTIRLGEWTHGGEIRHALKIEIDGSRYLSLTGGGFRWPAIRADAAATTKYGGLLPSLRMGSLLTLPPSYDVSALSSEPARILARALQRYGAYIVDNAGRDVVAYATEWGPQGRVLDEFEQEWGFAMTGLATRTTGAQRTFLAEVDAITTSLAVVDDNTVASIGGAGERLAPWAPPLAVPR